MGGIRLDRTGSPIKTYMLILSRFQGKTIAGLMRFTVALLNDHFTPAD